MQEIMEHKWRPIKLIQAITQKKKDIDRRIEIDTEVTIANGERLEELRRMLHRKLADERT